jgi:hypothetical protein
MTRRKLSIDEHKALAALLLDVREGLLAGLRAISGCRLTTRVGRHLDAALWKVDAARSELEDQMFRDWPREPEADIHVYYPRRELKCQTQPDVYVVGEEKPKKVLPDVKWSDD